MPLSVTATAFVLLIAASPAFAHASGHEVCDYTNPGAPVCTSTPEGAFILYTRQAKTIADLKEQVRRLQNEACPH
jgi:hypothetical protein